MLELNRTFPDVVFITVGMFDARTERRLQDQGNLVFTNPSRAVAAATALVNFGAAFSRKPVEPLPLNAFLAQPGQLPMNEAQGYALLAGAGIPVPPHRVVTSAAEAASAWQEMDAPVALKILSPDIAHKSDIGGVCLNLTAGDAVTEAFDVMKQRVSHAAPQARIDGVLMLPMQRDFAEMVIGARADDQLRPVVVVGLGGIFVELLDDVAVRLAPVTPVQALGMIDELKAARLLHGVRGHPPRDVQALAEAVSKLSCLIAASADWIKSIEINPFAVFAGDGGGAALDCAVR